ncbi:leucine-rich_repeat domain-containing protein [Hexamita inflata]|uniref:Leucine-rich repeat domain-containing protein n=1 Tax=Hexamita inflata TaxID=28002 RepID=A0AA86TJ37_9EUKA|nr:leucine-rich repeat domain-containing protein [Hexamita inflata]
MNQEYDEIMISKYSKSIQDNDTLVIPITEAQEVTSLTFIQKLSLLKLKLSLCTSVTFAQPPLNITELYLSQCKNTTFAGIEQMTQLQKLEMVFSQVTNSEIPLIGCLINLKYLNLKGNSITDISQLLNLTKIVELDMSSNKIDKIIDFDNFNQLKHLSIANNKLSDIPVLRCVKLETLSLEWNKLLNLEFLISLQSLTRLNLTGNKVQSISTLRYLKNLKELSVAANLAIQDINALMYCKLSNLKASYNKIVDISSLRFQQNMQKLSIEFNQIINVTCIQNLKFTELNLDGNSILDNTIFKLGDQKVPTTSEILFANKMKCINQFQEIQNRVKNSCNKLSRKLSTFQGQVNLKVDHIKIEGIKFQERVIALFEIVQYGSQ